MPSFFAFSKVLISPIAPAKEELSKPSESKEAIIVFSSKEYKAERTTS